MAADFDDKVDALVRNFSSEISRVHEDEAKTWENGNKVLALAKKLAEADFNNPDMVALGFTHAPLPMVAKGTVEFCKPVHPVWWFYCLEARAAIEFLAHLDKHELLDEDRRPVPSGFVPIVCDGMQWTLDKDAIHAEPVKEGLSLSFSDPALADPKAKTYRVEISKDVWRRMMSADPLAEPESPGGSAMAAVRDIAGKRS